MQTVKAITMLEDAYRFMGLDVDQLEERQEQEARVGLSLALQEVWEAWWWEELMTVTQQNLRDTYASGTTYAAGDEVYFPATQKYYQCIQATLGNAPALLDEETGGYETNVAFWLECELTRSVDDYVDGDDYDAGELVRNPDDGLIYAKLSGIRVTGAGLDYVNRDYPYHDDLLEKPRYGPIGSQIYWVSPSWRINSNVGSGVAYTSTDDVATPDLVTTWVAQAGGGGVEPLPTITASGPLTDSLFWGLANAFLPELETGKTVRSITRLNPRLTPNAGPYDFVRTVDGVLLTKIPDATPWVWARRVTPVLTGDDFDSAATYEATAASELVFDS